MNPILATLVLTSLITTIGAIILIRKDYTDRLEKYYGIFIVAGCFVVDGILVAALL
jgi:hypothetical protein